MGEGEDSAPRAGDEAAAELGAIVEEWARLANRQLDLNPGEIDSAEERRFWRLTARGLQLYAWLVDESVRTGRRITAPPLVARLMEHAGLGIHQAVAGNAPLAWRSKGRPKKRCVTDEQRIAIAHASAYYELNDANLIHDPDPISTIMERYACGYSTARGFRGKANELQYTNMLQAIGSVSGSPEKLPALRLEVVLKILTRAGMLYQRRAV